jgi:hypothetical protein
MITAKATASVQSTSNLQNKAQESFVSLTCITQACHGVLNTIFTAPDPKPDWFDDLDNKLTAAKANAAEWINTLAPDITGGVPAQVINYGTTYDALTAQIVSIADAHPDAQDADNQYVLQIKVLVEALDTEVTKIIANAQATSDSLEAWGEKMQISHDDLTTGAVSIQNAETDLQTDIDKMNSAISTLNDIIHQENIAIAASAGGIGLGLLMLVAGIALAPETAGASAYLVAGTGAALIVGGSITWGVMQDKINTQFDEIAKDQKELSADARQIVALQGLASATSQSITYITDSTNALSDFRTSWSVFQGELKGVQSKLELAEASVSIIVQEAFTNAAKLEWDDATKFAESLATTSVSYPTKEMPMDSNAA